MDAIFLFFIIAFSIGLGYVMGAWVAKRQIAEILKSCSDELQREMHKAKIERKLVAKLRELDEDRADEREWQTM